MYLISKFIATKSDVDARQKICDECDDLSSLNICKICGCFIPR